MRIEAMIAAAAAIAVVYPHMNGLGGDSFWLIGKPGSAPIGIQACGRSAMTANRNWYRERGCAAIPGRGPLSALTVAGTVGRLGEGAESQPPASTADGCQCHGFCRMQFVTRGRVYQFRIPFTKTPRRSGLSCKTFRASLRSIYRTAHRWLSVQSSDSRALRTRSRGCHKRACLIFIAATLRDRWLRIWEKAGSPLRLADLERHQATLVTPLSLDVAGHKVFNMPPPTQGLASLLILGLYARRIANEADGIDHVHRLVECTKAAFRVRNRHVTDPEYMERDATDFLTEEALAALDETVETERAAPWPVILRRTATQYGLPQPIAAV